MFLPVILVILPTHPAVFNSGHWLGGMRTKRPTAFSTVKAGPSAGDVARGSSLLSSHGLILKANFVCVKQPAVGAGKELKTRGRGSSVGWSAAGQGVWGSWWQL